MSENMHSYNIMARAWPHVASPTQKTIPKPCSQAPTTPNGMEPTEQALSLRLECALRALPEQWKHVSLATFCTIWLFFFENSEQYTMPSHTPTCSTDSNTSNLEDHTRLSHLALLLCRQISSHSVLRRDTTPLELLPIARGPDALLGCVEPRPMRPIRIDDDRVIWAFQILLYLSRLTSPT